MRLLEMESIRGLEHAETRVHSAINVEQHLYRFTPDADRKTVNELLKCVHGLRELMFFDIDHPSISDSGAFIFVVRLASEWLIRGANRGWTTDWVPIARLELQRYLYSCIPSNSGTGRSYIEVSENENRFRSGKVDRSRRARLRRYLDKRLKRRK